MDTANCTRYSSNDTSFSYEAEAFLKAEYRPNRQNDFMVYYGINPISNRIVSSSNTYRKEYIDDIGEYDYTINRETLQHFSMGSAGMSWQHRFAQPGQSLGILLNSDFSVGNDSQKEQRAFTRPAPTTISR